MIWWAVAYVIAFSCFTDASSLKHDHVAVELADSTIYFSFSQQQKAELNAYFESKNTHQGFNGVVLIGQKDSVFYSQPFGYANYAIRDSLTLNSAFQLASVSKQFTAVAILQLYEQQLLDVNDSIQKYWPDFPYPGITIHQLLTHRSGLPNYHYFLQHIPTTQDTMISNQDLVNEMILKAPEAYYPPNRRYHYSNTGYALLAAIVERVSGISFNAYLHKNIFQPLDMNFSYTYLDSNYKTYDNTTQGYLYRWRLAEHNYLDGVLGDKGVYCSAGDLFKWDQGLYSGKIISLDILNKAFQPMGKPAYYKSNYGYGWRMYHWGSDSIKVFFHGGWWHGYKSLLMRIPSDSSTIIVLKNRSKGGSINSKHLLQILYSNTISMADTVEIDTED